MTEVVSPPNNKSAAVDLTVPPLQLPDMTHAAETMLNQALDYCAQKIGIGDYEAIIKHLQSGDSVTSGFFQYSVANQLAEYLGVLDNEIRAVYLYDYDATPEDMAFGQLRQISLIHLIVWTGRKTNALYALIAAVSRALSDKYASLIGTDERKHMLDIQIVDDNDVEQRRGYGGLLNSTQYQPIRLWRR